VAGKTLDIRSLGINPDRLGIEIARKFAEWQAFRQVKISEWNEIRRYIFATDTTETTNSKLPWKNKTTIPKLCQIRDNLNANYMASLFPKRKWLYWEGDNQDSELKAKRDAIESYMEWAIDRSDFKNEVAKLVLDYIDYGNCFATVEWVDNTKTLKDKQQVGYVGPMPRRISPLDIVFNPISASFESSPKIIRTLLSLGELKKLLEQQTPPDMADEVQKIYEYLLRYRTGSKEYQPSFDLAEKDSYLHVDGFTNYHRYLNSGYVEVLTFYGDMYDVENDEILQNHVITVVDRHKVISKKPNESFFGNAPIYHAGWRVRQDNLWAMGPLDNLVGMQYRIDHLENLKADVMDLTVFPPLRIKGYVEDFEYGPMERIYMGDDGEVELLSPNTAALQVNTEIALIEQKMEEMAGSPKEAMGIRSPGEKTAYEVQRLESAAGRIFQSKISQFEEQVVEPLLNAMLEIARRKMGQTTIRAFNSEFKFATFSTLMADDLTGQGRLRPLAARHFAEKAEIIQNLTQFFNSPIGQDQDVKVHFSGVRVAEMMEELLNLEDYKLVEPYVRLSEQADAQRLANSHTEQVGMEAMTPAGIAEDDSTLPMPPMPQQMPQQQ
jgi:Bacteriophage head to tail connecting protein